MTTGATPEANASFTELAQRVDELRDQVAREGERSQELLRGTIDAITAFNRAGLAALVQVLRSDARGTELLYEAVDLPEVMALMASHGIIRTDLTLDVLRVVDQLRPHLLAASVNLEVVQVDGDVLTLRYNGHRPDDDVVDGIRDALLSRVGGLRVVQESADESVTSFVPISGLKVRPR
ncbi:MAG TPA: hypothetical protein VMV53_00545 [Acidimicrobiales bacterium]|nr:hypothetical protein [Acidimicrobiales bacterium]